MKVRCLIKTILRPALDNPQKTESFDYTVEVGESYVVYSIMLWDGKLEYLLADSYGNSPLWYPAELFEVTNFLFPCEWYYKFRGYKKDPLTALWGYKEMIFDTEKHYTGILEGEREALEIFFKRKQEIDEDEELNKYREKKA